MADSVVQTKSFKTEILKLPPSCIETCPWDQQYFAIGTYYLERNEEPTGEQQAPNEQEQVDEEQGPPEVKAQQQRNGSILLYKFSQDLRSFDLVQTLPTMYAILDMHWHQQSRSLWTANSTGSLASYSFGSEGNTVLSHSNVLQLWPEDLLVLSFNFDPIDLNWLVATLSDGSVVLCRMQTSNLSTQVTETISSHELEAWTVSTCRDSILEKGMTVLSGGDDAVLQCNHISLETDPPQVEARWKNRRIHGAGVTAILPIFPGVILTGSYDDHIRVLDVQSAPKLMAEKNLEGGVWRLKELYRSSDSSGATELHVLASCMHAGARIVRIVFEPRVQEASYPELAHLDVIARFEEHESMNYGSDAVVRGREYTILSTSFYDKRLCLWKYHIK